MNNSPTLYPNQTSKVPKSARSKKCTAIISPSKLFLSRVFQSISYLCPGTPRCLGNAVPMTFEEHDALHCSSQQSPGVKKVILIISSPMNNFPKSYPNRTSKVPKSARSKKFAESANQP